MMSIAEYTLLQDLRRRVEALEQAQASRLRPLEQQNRHRRANSERLRAVIRQAMGSWRGPGKISAKHVLRALREADISCSQLPSLRAIQWHMRAIRSSS